MEDKTVLIVDDVSMNRELLKEFLNVLYPNWATVDAKDGEEAVEIAKGGDIDLILMDVMMPKMDGTEALKEIRDFSDVPIIMVTCCTEKFLDSYASGSDGYIVKPITLELIREAIEKVI